MLIGPGQFIHKNNTSAPSDKRASLTRMVMPEALQERPAGTL